MKKLLSLVLIIVMLLSSFTAFADDLDFLIGGPKNYTMDYTVDITFDSADDIAALLKEVNMPAQIEAFVDIKGLLASLLSTSSTMNLKADMSEDYSKIKIALISDADWGVDVNANFSVSAKIKMGMWMDIDLSNLENPSLRIVYSNPMFNKYIDMDVFEMLPEEQHLMTAALIKSFVNKEFIDETCSFTKELYEKYADVKTTFNICKINIDNAGFTAMMDEIFEYLAGKLSVMFPYEQTGVIIPEIPSVKGFEILGDDGIKFEYNNRTGDIKCTSDISVSITDIYTSLTGNDWLLESECVLDFKVVENGRMYNENITKVTFPELTAENSLTYVQFMEMMNPVPETENDVDEYEAEYPWFYAYADSTYMPDIDGKIYVPMRALIESAYEDSVSMTFSKGVVTMTSEYFTDFECISYKSGETKVNVDGTDVEVGKIVIADGVTYVSTEFFEKVFGWAIESASYDILNDTYYFGFYTEAW